jgi:hypothetical protein
MQEPTSESQVAKRRSLAAYAAGTTVALLAVGVTALLFYWLWSLSRQLDASGGRRGLTAQLMQRKTATMSEIHAGLASGDFDRAEQAAAMLRQISETSEWYLPDKSYAELSEDFRGALGALDGALRDGDLAQLASTYNRLARSCVDCHQKATNSQVDKESLQFLKAVKFINQK